MAERDSAELAPEAKQDDADSAGLKGWHGVIHVTRSPLRMFALIVLVCNSVFGVAAASSYDQDVFVYTLHTFLAVVACFMAVALWSPAPFTARRNWPNWPRLRNA